MTRPDDGFTCPKELTARQLWRQVRTLSPADAINRVRSTELELLHAGTAGAQQGYGDLLAIRAVTLAREDDTLSAAAAAEQALLHGATGEFQRLMNVVLRYCAWKAGTMAADGDSTHCALASMSRLRRVSPNNTLADVLDLTLAAAIEFGQLNVSSAERLARCALLRAGRSAALGAAPASVLARILYEQGQLEEAEKLLGPRLAVIRTAGSVDCVGHAHAVLARIAAHAGDRSGALVILEQGCRLAEARNWPRLLAAMLAERIRLSEQKDEGRTEMWFAQLGNLAARHGSCVRCARSDIICHFFRAQIYRYLTFRTGAPPRAALAHLHHEAWLSRNLQALAWTDLAEAQICWIEGDTDRSVRCLTKAIRAAACGGLSQLLSDASGVLPWIGEKFLQGGAIGEELLAFTICALGGRPRRTSTSSRSKARQAIGGDRRGRDGDNLTARERDVLRLIGEGQTNKLIAQMQGVAPETVKSHLKNIFVKLGVERRAQAFAKAQRLGLLAPT